MFYPLLSRSIVEEDTFGAQVHLQLQSTRISSLKTKAPRVNNHTMVAETPHCKSKQSILKDPSSQSKGGDLLCCNSRLSFIVKEIGAGRIALHR